MRIQICVVVLISLLSLGCTSTSGPRLRSAQLQANYPNLLDKSFTDRVGMIPSVLLDDLKSMDSHSNYLPHELSLDERALFENTFVQLPDFLKEPLQAEVFDIYFVENFSGGGMTYFIWKDGKPKYILIFNPKTFHQTLSEWLTYRDNTAFDSSNSQFSLRETESGNHIGFLHTLVHESCHVYDFVHGVWKNQASVLPESDFPVRSKLSFYDVESTAKVPITDFVSEFDLFTKAGFASIYGSWNSLDDFAENETYVLLDKKYMAKLTLEIEKDNMLVKSYVSSNSPVVLGRNSEFMEINSKK